MPKQLRYYSKEPCIYSLREKRKKEVDFFSASDCMVKAHIFPCMR